MTNVLGPLEAPYPPEIAARLERYPQRDGYLLQLFRTFANSERFLERGVPNLLDPESPLPLRIREIVILRVSANRHCNYEWGVHATIFAKAAGFSEAQLEDTAKSTVDPGLWTAEETDLIAAVDALCADGRMPGDVLERFRAAWSVEQQLEIFALCGAYSTVSFVANCSDLPGESFARPFPDRG